MKLHHGIFQQVFHIAAENTGQLIEDLELPEEPRPIGKWGRIHRDYLRENKPIQYNCLLLSGRLWTYLADLDEQAQDRLERIIDQMKATEGITEALKASDPMVWVQRMNNICQLGMVLSATQSLE